MQNKFTIGQMAKLYHIPVKTLRYYDEIGLFQPFEVDKQTGYRYYCSEQFQVLDTIWYLRTMGVPLKEIKKKVEHSTVDEFIQTLMEYEKINTKKMNELRNMNEKLQAKIKELREAKRIATVHKPTLSFIPERKVIEVKGQFQSLNDIEDVLRKLKKKINHITPVMVGKVGLTVSVDRVKDGNLNEFEGVYILLEENTDVIHDLLVTFPEGSYVTIYTRDEGRQQTDYDRILSYIEEKGYEPYGPFLLRQIVDSFISHQEKERLTEIRIRVKKRNM
ncbi:MerR family transcriptional regulator [Bacillus sp. N1-1]|uniref:MerR family transcriptional regulator n=1 Tax=Bacillus sp. N1-1 TaxID=2682541 RepID=UPI001316A1B5|nr:MerR family transcriptional regulator [Bacillus sp. N1-1]QHA90998.1 MerR family transcriptional regulator [Bacillus sp. N1-1]